MHSTQSDTRGVPNAHTNIPDVRDVPDVYLDVHDASNAPDPRDAPDILNDARDVRDERDVFNTGIHEASAADSTSPHLVATPAAETGALAANDSGPDPATASQQCILCSAGSDMPPFLALGM